MERVLTHPAALFATNTRRKLGAAIVSPQGMPSVSIAQEVTPSLGSSI